jgi:hypothetical protein
MVCELPSLSRRTLTQVPLKDARKRLAGLKNK